MAANTYKKVPKEEKVKEKKSRKSSVRQEESRERFYHDKRFQLASGIFLIFISLLLFVAFFSFLFTGKQDQSVVDSLFHESMHESGGCLPCACLYLQLVWTGCLSVCTLVVSIWIQNSLSALLYSDEHLPAIFLFYPCMVFLYDGLHGFAARVRYWHVFEFLIRWHRL
jgi:hypothetical protein